MVYSQQGIIKDSRHFSKFIVAGVAAVALAVAIFAQTFAATVVPTKYTEYPFTDSELALWEVDRAVPSGEFSSVDGFEGRNDVLEMNVDTDNRSNLGSFYYTEVLKRGANGADVARADLFVDSSWLTTDVRAGLWGVGENDFDVITAYPIVEFTTDGDYEGWRVFNDEVGGWINLTDAEFNTDEWNTVEIKFNPESTVFDV